MHSKFIYVVFKTKIIVIEWKYLFVVNEIYVLFEDLSIIIYNTILPFMLLIKDSVLLWRVVRKQETMKLLK